MLPYRTDCHPTPRPTRNAFNTIRALGLTLLIIALALPRSADARPIMAAHRGLSDGHYPENSLAAFRYAISQGIEVIEIDLRLTADGTIVVIHDATVKRTSNGTGEVAAMSLAEIKALDIGAGERIPTLAEVLTIVRGTRTSLILDIKHGGALPAHRVLADIHAGGAIDQVIVGTRTINEVRAYRALAPSIPILAFASRYADVDNFVAAGANIIRLWPKWLSSRRSGCRAGAGGQCIVSMLQRRGLAIWALADAPRDTAAAVRLFSNLSKLGVDGILTNRPDLAALASNRP